MSNPNLFKQQTDPDGKKGHKQRELLRKVIDKESHQKSPQIEPNRFVHKLISDDLGDVTKKEIRKFQIKTIRESCEFYDKNCEKTDCIDCKSKVVPLKKIKNLIDWIN